MKKEEKNLSAKRRINEARSRGAKRFYEWDATRDRAWLRAYDKYLDRLAGDYGESHDDSLRDKYDQVWVHGYTEEIPLVVFEGDKKYLASYEYEVAGKIDAEAEEVFQLTDALEFITFDLYEFPKDGIPANWNEKDDIIVASISDDAERLNGITVAGGTPVVKALEDQMIKEVERAYYNEDVEEYYPDNYDPDYDDIELDVDLVYEGELNEKSDKDMKESVEEKAEESSEERMKESASWFKKEEFEIENEYDDPLKVLKDGKEYEGYYNIVCKASYSGDDSDLDSFESELDDYDLAYLELIADDSKDDIVIEEDKVGTPETEELLKSLTVVLDDNRTIPFLDFMKATVEDGVEEHGYNLDIDYWNDWDGVPDIDDEY